MKYYIVLISTVISFSSVAMEINPENNVVKTFDFREPIYYQLLKDKQRIIIDGVAALDRNKTAYGMSSLLFDDHEFAQKLAKNILNNQFSVLPELSSKEKINFSEIKKTHSPFLKSVEYTALLKMNEMKKTEKDGVVPKIYATRETKILNPLMLILGGAATLYVTAKLPDNVNLAGLLSGIVGTVYLADKNGKKSFEKYSMHYPTGSHAALAEDNYKMVVAFNNAHYQPDNGYLLAPTDLNKK